jgi:hypothetical protein
MPVAHDSGGSAPGLEEGVHMGGGAVGEVVSDGGAMGKRAAGARCEGQWRR